MLIPADDQALMAISTHYADFNGDLCIGCPPPGITDLILDKRATLQVAEQCGIPIPKTRLISNSAELLESASSIPFPWVLKPARKETTVEKIKCLTLASKNEIAVKFSQAQDFSPPMLLQEYCKGDGVGIEMLIHDGECRALFQHRRLKEFPHTGGVSVSAIAERPNVELVEMARTQLRALRWQGPAMVEFKVDPHGRSAVLLEVNGRYWGTISLPVLAGIDFPFYHWQLVHGEQPDVPAHYAAGTRWRWTAGHLARLNSLLIASRRSHAARGELFRAFSNLSSLFDVDACDPLAAPSDPIPAILDLAHMLKYLGASDMDGLVKSLSRHLVRKARH